MTAPVPEGWESPLTVTFTPGSAGLAAALTAAAGAAAAREALDLVRTGRCDCCGASSSLRDLVQATGHPRIWERVCAERTACLRRAVKAAWEAERARADASAAVATGTVAAA